jgi:hypothetical protein
VKWTKCEEVSEVDYDKLIVYSINGSKHEETIEDSFVFQNRLKRIFSHFATYRQCRLYRLIICQAVNWVYGLSRSQEGHVVDGVEVHIACVTCPGVIGFIT